MELENKKAEIEWYDNPGFITNLIIGLIAIVIILSQSFAVNNNLSTHEILSSIIIKKDGGIKNEKISKY